MQAQRVSLPVRHVQKVTGGYVVQEREGHAFKNITKVYPHSTSAYAALGRMTDKQTILELTK